MTNNQIEYRTKFLRSEDWRTLRIACLARDNAICRICRKRDISNDAHHIRYPRNGWRHTRRSDLRTLCRSCHEKVHELMIQNPGITWGQIKSKLVGKINYARINWKRKWEFELFS